LSGPGVTREQAAAAIGEVYAAIEIIDSRIVNWDIRLVDTVADNASCGAIAVGTTPPDVDVSDLSSVQCTLLIDGHSTDPLAKPSRSGDTNVTFEPCHRACSGTPASPPTNRT